MPNMHRLAVLVAALLGFACVGSAFDTQTCKSHQLYVVVKVDRNIAEDILRHSAGKDAGAVSIEKRAEYSAGAKHPIFIELDDFNDCHVPFVPFLPHNKFQEFAFQVPYAHHSTTKGRASTYQPEAWVNNNFGLFAVTTIGGKREKGDFQVDMDISKSSGSYEVKNVIKATYSVSTTNEQSMEWEQVSSLRKTDKDWVLVENAKNQLELCYGPCIGGNAFTCSNFVYHFDDPNARARRVSGSVELGKELLERLPMLKGLNLDFDSEDVMAYEAQASWTVGMGCKAAPQTSATLV